MFDETFPKGSTAEMFKVLKPHIESDGLSPP